MFRNRNELSRRDQAASWMRPTRQRFDGNDLFATGVDDRLVQDLEALLLDGLAQILLDQLALGQIGVHYRIINAGAIATLVLGAIERHVGIAHDVSRVATRAAVDLGNRSEE